MSAEAPPAKPQRPLCSSALCKVLSSIPFFGAGYFVARTVRDTVDGNIERFRKPSVLVGMCFATGLIAWGLTLLVHVPIKKNS